MIRQVTRYTATCDRCGVDLGLWQQARHAETVMRTHYLDDHCRRYGVTRSMTTGPGGDVVCTVEIDHSPDEATA